MSPAVKFLIGLVAVLAIGWVWHGPLGRGEGFVGMLEQQARQAVATTELKGIEVRLGHDPLSRTATLSGTANDLQREGLGSQYGINDYVRSVPGIARVRWSDEKAGARTVPLLAETLLLLSLAYAVGFGLGRLIFGRRKRQSFLDY
ncbi:MAG TPA: hypothetical protein VF727_01135 [Allosphingosinicella sp.]|jgi:hypothetical protein